MRPEFPQYSEDPYLPRPPATFLDRLLELQANPRMYTPKNPLRSQSILDSTLQLLLEPSWGTRKECTSGFHSGVQLTYATNFGRTLKLRKLGHEVLNFLSLHLAHEPTFQRDVDPWKFPFLPIYPRELPFQAERLLLLLGTSPFITLALTNWLPSVHCLYCTQYAPKIARAPGNIPVRNAEAFVRAYRGPEIFAFPTSPCNLIFPCKHEKSRTRNTARRNRPSLNDIPPCYRGVDIMSITNFPELRWAQEAAQRSSPALEDYVRKLRHCLYSEETFQESKIVHKSKARIQMMKDSLKRTSKKRSTDSPLLQAEFWYK